MPNYLAADQVITVSFRGVNSQPAYVVSFNPDTGDVNWVIGTPGTNAAFLLNNIPAPVAIITNGFQTPDNDGIGAAVNPARDRLLIFQKFFFVYIFDENLVQLDMIDLTALVVGYVETRAIAALPSGNFLLLVEVFTSAQFWHYLEITKAGALVALHLTTTPTSAFISQKTVNQMAVSTDGKQAAYIEPFDATGQAYDGGGGPTAPPAVPYTDPDNLTGPWGNVVRRYDLVNNVELASVDVDADPIKGGIGFAASKQLITGAAGQALSCSPATTHCALAATTFGPGFVTRELVTGTRRQLYPADPELVWFEEQGDILSRSTSGWWTPEQSWRITFRAMIGANVLGVGQYRTLFVHGNPDYSGAFIWIGSDENNEVLVEFSDGGSPVRDTALAPLTPYQEHRFDLFYYAPLQRFEFWLDDILIDTLSSLDLTGFAFDTAQQLGVDDFVDSVADLGISRFKIYDQNAVLLANTPLTGADNVIDAKGSHNWTRGGSLATDALVIDRYGDERGSIGVDADGLYFWHAKYVRQFNNSRLMLVERNIARSLRRRLFLIDWQNWEGPNGGTFAYYPAIHSIVPLITNPPIEDDDVTGEEEFVAGGTTGVLTWIEHTRKSD